MRNARSPFSFSTLTELGWGFLFSPQGAALLGFAHQHPSPSLLVSVLSHLCASPSALLPAVARGSPHRSSHGHCRSLMMAELGFTAAIVTSGVFAIHSLTAA